MLKKFSNTSIDKNHAQGGKKIEKNVDQKPSDTTQPMTHKRPKIGKNVLFTVLKLFIYFPLLFGGSATRLGGFLSTNLVAAMSQSPFNRSA
jgi:hypothetical protein